MEYLKKLDDALSNLILWDKADYEQKGYPVIAGSTWTLPRKRVLYFAVPDAFMRDVIFTQLDELWMILSQLPLISTAYKDMEPRKQDEKVPPEDSPEYFPRKMRAIDDPKKRMAFLRRYSYLIRELEAFAPAAPVFELRNYQPETQEALFTSFFTNPKYRFSILIVTAAAVSIPQLYEDEVEVFSVGLPTRNDYREMLLTLHRTDHAFCTETDEADILTAAANLAGMSMAQAENILSDFWLHTGCRFYTQIQNKYERSEAKEVFDRLVRNEKQKMSQNDSLLEYAFFESMDDVACSESYDQWLTRNEKVFSDRSYAASRGIKPPDGVIMAGLAGTGKTLMAKYTACRLGVPLLTLKLELMKDHKQGETEKRLHYYLERVKEKAPAILLIDELEKKITTNASSTDSQHTMIAMLLEWLQKNESVMAFFTSNDVTPIDSAMLRSGRVSEHYFCFLPCAEELAGIMLVHLRKKNAHSKREANEKGYPNLYDRSFRDFLEDDSDAPKKKLLELVNKIRPARDIEEGWLDHPLLFTGADMERFLSKVNNHLRITFNDQMNYSYEQFEEAFLSQAAIAYPAGVTDMPSIVKTWLLMKERKYQNISTKPLVPMEYLGPDNRFIKKDEWMPKKDTEHYDYYLSYVVCAEIEKALAGKSKN